MADPCGNAPDASTTTSSPFLRTPVHAQEGSLAILHLQRDNLLPITLRSTADDGYAEGPVTNTRYGSYPHSTLIGIPWGCQVRASKVDTGTRGRKPKPSATPLDIESHPPVPVSTGGGGDSRKRHGNDPDPTLPSAKRQRRRSGTPPSTFKAPVEAGSGFTHMLQPTPETWTSSLDHRTQVVYVPDYSYILTRLRVRPGSTLIEAGAGSGSFTHAAATAVFGGPPDATVGPDAGAVHSFEYHEPRARALADELRQHGLDSVVRLTQRDVCAHGFSLSSAAPKADAVFLDLPAPWLALRHLTRDAPDSPLDPRSPVRLCTFSPCIEQVISTVAALRGSGWTDVRAVEVQNRRVDVRRERVGLREQGLKGVVPVAATVEESVARLREVEAKLKEFHAGKVRKSDGDDNDHGHDRDRPPTKAQRLDRIKRQAGARKLFTEGELVHRTQAEVKTHTSYLVFAVLPRAWTAADEEACSLAWPVRAGKR